MVLSASGSLAFTRLLATTAIAASLCLPLSAQARVSLSSLQNQIQANSELLAALEAQNLIVLGMEDGGGAALMAVLDDISDASAENPYTIQLGPGIWDITQITLSPGITLKGSGREATIIRDLVGDNSSNVYSVTTAANTALQDLTVRCDATSTGNDCRALRLLHGAQLDHVTTQAISPLEDAVAIAIDEDFGAAVQGLKALASGARPTGVLISGGDRLGTVTLLGASISVDSNGSGEAIGISEPVGTLRLEIIASTVEVEVDGPSGIALGLKSTSAQAAILGSQIRVLGSQANVGIEFSGEAIDIQDSLIELDSSDSNAIGVYSGGNFSDAGAILLNGVRINMVGGFGVYGDPDAHTSSVAIHNSHIKAGSGYFSTISRFERSHNLRVFSSVFQVVDVTGGEFFDVSPICVNVVKGDMTSVPADCDATVIEDTGPI